MKCSGRSAVSGEPIEITFELAIQNVDPVLDHEGDMDVFVAPGFIDLQVNGFAGVDFNSPSAPHDEIERAIVATFSTGVTRFYPTVITGAPDAMLAALRNLAAARESLTDGRAMEAFHVEGPHISPDDGPRGAHPREWVRPPDFGEFQRFQDAAQGHVRLITISPHWPGAPRYIEQITELGVVASIGHTRATPQQIRDYISSSFVVNMLMGDMDPQMFHQSNLHAYDGTHSLLGDLYDATFTTYFKLLNLPVLSPSLDVLGKNMQNRDAYNRSGVTASVVSGPTPQITISVPAGSPVASTTIPVTGLNSPGAEIYGGQNISHLPLNKGQSVTLPLQ